MIFAIFIRCFNLILDVYKIILWLQDFHVDTLEKFVEESSTPVVTVFNNDPNNHPFVVKFFNSPNAKVMGCLSQFCSFNIELKISVLITLLQLNCYLLNTSMVSIIAIAE